MSSNTYTTTPAAIERKWFVVDAEGKTLGRMATVVASILRGKHKPVFTPSLDCGDHVIVINAAKVVLTGKKLTDKMYRHHSRFPGGLKEIPYGQFLQAQPEKAIELAIKGMLPHNRLGRQMFRKLRVYRGAEHSHAAQQPQPWSSKL